MKLSEWLNGEIEQAHRDHERSAYIRYMCDIRDRAISLEDKYDGVMEVVKEWYVFHQMGDKGLIEDTERRLCVIAKSAEY